MTRGPVLFCTTLLIASVSAFATPKSQPPLDPVGFCPPPATMGGCTTATGLTGETIGVGATSVGMMKNGDGGTASDPWYLLIAVPNDTGGAPTITFDGGVFTQTGSTRDAGQFRPTTSGDIYTFALGSSPDTNSSMNASNLFCDGKNFNNTNTGCAGNYQSNEIQASGSFPSFFEIFVYTFSPEIANNTPYTLSIGGAGLAAGTYLAADGGDQPFSTPFTTAGLVNGPGCTPDTCGGGGGGGSVPEPASIVLLGTVSIVLANLYRKKARVN